MPFEVRLHRLAIKEYRDARARYFAVRPRLGEKFRDAIDAALDRVAADPESLPVHKRQYRSIRTKRFPYVIFFRVFNERTVVVAAIAHTSRRPDYWIRRRIDFN